MVQTRQGCRLQTWHVLGYYAFWTFLRAGSPIVHPEPFVSSDLAADYDRRRVCVAGSLPDLIRTMAAAARRRASLGERSS